MKHGLDHRLPSLREASVQSFSRAIGITVPLRIDPVLIRVHPWLKNSSQQPSTTKTKQPTPRNRGRLWDCVFVVRAANQLLGLLGGFVFAVLAFACFFFLHCGLGGGRNGFLLFFFLLFLLLGCLQFVFGLGQLLFGRDQFLF